MAIFPLHSTVMPYAWGSRTALAALRGEPGPAPAPEAELWLGAHPHAPSRVEVGGELRSLAEVIAADPPAILGAAAAARFGGRLPFLVKLLAAERPLSIQTHPDDAQAAAGFAEEEAAGIGRDDAARCFRDPYGKPELLVALAPFEALCGCRPAAEAAELVAGLAAPALAGVVAALRGARDPGAGQRAAWARILAATGGDRAALAGEATAASARAADAPGELGAACRCALRLAVEHPGDPALLAALLLRRIELAPGQAMFLAPRAPHTYLGGLAVEVMAASDNVVRAGLTPKRIDVARFLALADFAAAPPPLPEPAADPGGERVYEAPTGGFRVSRVDLGDPGAVGGAPWRPAARDSAEILVCTAGRARVAPAGDGEPVLLAPTDGAFVSAGEPYQVASAGGAATIFRVTVP